MSLVVYPSSYVYPQNYYIALDGFYVDGKCMAWPSVSPIYSPYVVSAFYNACCSTSKTSFSASNSSPVHLTKEQLDDLFPKVQSLVNGLAEHCLSLDQENTRLQSMINELQSENAKLANALSKYEPGKVAPVSTTSYQTSEGMSTLERMKAELAAAKEKLQTALGSFGKQT